MYFVDVKEKNSDTEEGKAVFIQGDHYNGLYSRGEIELNSEYHRDKSGFIVKGNGSGQCIENIRRRHPD